MPKKKSSKPQKKPTSNKNFLRFVIISLLFISFLTFSFLFFSNSKKTTQTQTKKTEDKVIIGLSLGTLRTERWQRDIELIEKKATEMNALINLEVANEKSDIQISQAENLINQGVDVLIVVPYSSETSAKIVEMAHEKNIKVIAYDRMILSDELDYYVSFDNEKVGEFQAQGVLDVVSKGNFAYIGGSSLDNNAFLLKDGTMSVIQPLIDKGDINLVLESFTPEWRHEEAYKTMNQFLNSGKSIDAVIAANDGTAFGVIKALEEHGLAGKVPVSGQDAELTACQRIVNGTQTLTVYKPINLLADKAVEMAVDIARGKVINTNKLVNNGKTQVPSFLLESIPVNQNNLEATVIKDGFHSYQDIFK